MENQVTDNGRNPYFEGPHGAEEPADTAARLDLVQERDALSRMVTWAYSKLHSRAFSSMEDALELYRLKLYVEHGIRAERCNEWLAEGQSASIAGVGPVPKRNQNQLTKDTK